MTSDDKQDYRIEEYKALRTEMIRHMEGIERNLIACITATAVALVYGLKESPFVLIVANAIPIYFWIQSLNNRNKIAKIGSYIETFLEGPGTRLMWERRTHNEYLNSPGSHPSALLPLYLLPYQTLLIASLLTTFQALKSRYFPSLPLSVTVSVSVIILVMIWLMAKYLTIPFDNLLKQWKKSFEDIKQLEEPAPVSPDLTQSTAEKETVVENVNGRGT